MHIPVNVNDVEFLCSYVHYYAMIGTHPVCGNRRRLPRQILCKMSVTSGLI